MLNLDFRRFNRFEESATVIPNKPGSYIVCLKPDAVLPKSYIAPVFIEFNGFRVLYTGISNNLRSRDTKHFRSNNAGRSTLRKSLGVLFGYKQIPRDKDPNTSKTKFAVQDEEQLSLWMQDSLIFYFCQNPNCIYDEQELINTFNPPLNLDKNQNPVNADYRRMVSFLRKSK